MVSAFKRDLGAKHSAGVGSEPVDDALTGMLLRLACRLKDVPQHQTGFGRSPAREGSIATRARTSADREMPPFRRRVIDAERTANGLPPRPVPQRSGRSDLDSP